MEFWKLEYTHTMHVLISDYASGSIVMNQVSLCPPPCLLSYLPCPFPRPPCEVSTLATPDLSILHSDTKKNSCKLCRHDHHD